MGERVVITEKYVPIFVKRKEEKEEGMREPRTATKATVCLFDSFIIPFPCTPTRETNKICNLMWQTSGKGKKLKKEDVEWMSSNSQERNNKTTKETKKKTICMF